MSHNEKDPCTPGQRLDTGQVIQSPDNSPAGEDNQPLKQVTEYVRQGYSVIPIPHKNKRPQIAEWQKLRLTEEDLSEHFGKGQTNIGVLLGEPSRGLIDVDLDSEEAVKIAARFLPNTLMFGRKGRPRSHWLFRCRPEPSYSKLSDESGKCIVELRSTGQQTVFPGSVHASGESIEFDSTGHPKEIRADQLLLRVKLLASATIFARHWPDPGTRQDAALALSGGLLRAGWDKKSVRHFLSAVCHAAGDDESKKRLEAVHQTDKRLEADEPVTGWPRLRKLVGNAVLTKVHEWLDIEGGTDGVAPYRASHDGIIWDKPTKDGVVETRLTNFTAQITKEIELDDGLEPQHSLEIEAKLHNRLVTFMIPGVSVFKYVLGHREARGGCGCLPRHHE